MTTVFFMLRQSLIILRWFVGLVLLVGAKEVDANVLLPSINTNNVILVTNAAYGAIGNGVTDNTTAIQNAINAAAKGALTNNLRGGTVEIPAGTNTYLCGPLNFSNNVGLQIDAGAILQLLPYGAWPGSPYTGTVLPLLNGSGLTNIAVTGSGLIDGQGAAWWPRYSTNNRPVIVNFSSCSEVLLQNFTSSNPPVAHIAIKGAHAGNVSVIGVKLLAPDSSDPVNPSHNTDGCDFAETNALFQNCVISTGDDNIAMGSSGSTTSDILVTNCFFGYGHGCSIGSYTSGGVSNITVTSCTFSNTGNGIKIKSERNRGGVVQNCNYYNLTMTNVSWPIQLYSYYEYGLGTLTTLTPGFVAYTAFTSTNPVPYEPPIYRNITISNVTANVPNGQPPLLVWGLPDYPISNIVLKNVNLTSGSSSTSAIYNATNIQFIDCSLLVPAGNKTVQLWNANVIFTNSSASTNQYLLDGLTTNGVGNTLAFYNVQVSLKNTNVMAGGALTIAGSTLTVSNSLTLTPFNPLNFVVGTNPATVAVKGNLAVGGGSFAGGTVNVTAGPGFTNGTYPLLTYTGNFSGTAQIPGTKPSGYTCFWGSIAAGQLDFTVLLPPPGTPTNLTALGTNLLIILNWSASSNAAGYNLQRSTTNGGAYSTIASLAGTNYSDATVSPGVAYFYVVSATNFSQESAGSIQASAIPLPSLGSTNLCFQAVENQMQLSWPPDHLGWRLQIQTNDLSSGLGTNWVDWPGSTNVFQTNLVINPANGSVFLRLIYP